jgi:predicted ThiF/HesA family dinucleotide-utilizing enzyme
LTDLDISPIVRSQYVRLNVDLVTFDITGGDGVPRTANITRKTKETKINMKLALDGSGECRIKTAGLRPP